MIKTRVEFDQYEGAFGSWMVSTSKDGANWYALNVRFGTEQDAQDVADLISERATA